MATKLKFGLLIPHFGEYGTIERCVEGAKKAEAYGFDSVWVRDHLIFEPHGMEGQDNKHIECLLVLAAISSVTKKINLGTATIIPHRHPILLAQSMAGLSDISNGRVIMGIGLGTFPAEFSAVGFKNTLEDRANLCKSSVQICRELWTGKKVSWEDPYFSFKDVELKPTPVEPIPVWYGGGTPAACRRAVDYCDGFMPGRIPTATFAKLVDYLQDLCRQAGKPMVTTGAIPITSIGRDLDSALKDVNVKGLINEGNKKPTWVKPASGTFSKLEDVEGLLMAGTPEDIVRDTRRFEQAGLNHIVYDFRFRYDDWYDQIDLLGKEVLPALRA
jgi:alkanesulfonate monooxygenase SsuD/methylene tetrahydromethanopterin reductase-like flavin-dependent oxidoreductase (luciferase family)